ncbi:hypothetical protein CR513_29601, partial [Mucuna pruriens]
MHTCDGLQCILVMDCNYESKKYKKQDYVMCFLVGLNECYLVVNTQILLMDPLPPLSHVFSMLLKHERQNGLDGGGESQVVINATNNMKFNKLNQVVINATNNNKFNKGKYSRDKFYTFSGRIGHTMDTCFRKHGFLSGSKLKENDSIVNNIDSDEDDLNEKIE